MWGDWPFTSLDVFVADIVRAPEYFVSNPAHDTPIPAAKESTQRSCTRGDELSIATERIDE